MFLKFIAFSVFFYLVIKVLSRLFVAVTGGSVSSGGRTGGRTYTRSQSTGGRQTSTNGRSRTNRDGDSYTGRKKKQFEFEDLEDAEFEDITDQSTPQSEPNEQ